MRDGSWAHWAASSLLLAALLGAASAQAQTRIITADRFQLNSGPCLMRSGSGSPESAVAGVPCDTYWDATNAALFIKLTGTGTTGWSSLARQSATGNYWFGWQGGSLPASSSDWLFSGVAGDSYVRWEVKANGDLSWGGGSSAVDLMIGRTGANTLGIGNADSFIPITGYSSNLGSLAYKFLTLHAAELWVETLVAQNTIATIGGRILVGPTTLLTSDLSDSATTISVKHNALANGDRVYLEADGKVEFLAITSAPGGSGPYAYTVTRNLDGTGANVWYAGDAVFDTGTTGSGFIDLYSVRGVKAATEYGPTIVGNVRNSATYNDWSPRWALGNLHGVYGYGAMTYGFAAGNAADVFLAVDATNGIRLIEGGSIVRGHWATDGSLFIGNSATGGRFAVTAGGEAQVIDASNKIRMKLQTDGSMGLGADLGSGSYPGTWLTSAAVTTYYDANNYAKMSTSGFQVYGSGAEKFRVDTSGNLSMTGDLAVGTGGIIRSGATAYGTGTGYWLDYNAGNPRFRIGDPAGARMSWDGSALAITDATFTAGSLTVNSSGIDLNGGAGTKVTFGSNGDITYSSGYLTVYASNIAELYGGNGVVIRATGTHEISTEGNIIPNVPTSWDLGSSSSRFKDLYLASALYMTDPGSTTSDDYPVVWSSGNQRLYYKTNGVNEPAGACASGEFVTSWTIDRGIVASLGCEAPAADRLALIEQELAALKSEISRLRTGDIQ